MANNLYQQLNNAPSLQSDVTRMMRMVSEARDPQQVLLNLADRNGAVANVLKEVRANGGDAKSLFYQRAEAMGVDPSLILKQLK